tara:strand:+ start:2271 stop:3464 length:1194 start_codon:yes stop_codon:yes gene_type:complete
LHISEKKILIIITGSIAAYKSCDIVRELRKRGAKVTVMMSDASQKFIGKSTLSALSGTEVITDLFSNDAKQGLQHVELSHSQDAILVVPATQNILCKVANGIADDVVSTTLSICEQKTLFIPAMNSRMWQNKSTQDAVRELRIKGKYVQDPVEGELASRHYGEGRLPEKRDILNYFFEVLGASLPLKGKRVLVTAGPTRESIDPVRYLSNKSSGKMGYAIAEKASEFGADTTLISGPVSIQPPPGIDLYKITTACELLNTMEELIIEFKPDYLFMVAAVADFIPKNTSASKIKREDKIKTIDFKSAPDVLLNIPRPESMKVIAFSLDSEKDEEKIMTKLKNKKADFIVYNSASNSTVGMESNMNEVSVYSINGLVVDIKIDTKAKIADKILNTILID